MGFADAFLGSSPSVDWRHKRTDQQVQMGSLIEQLLGPLFKPGGWQSLLPTGRTMSTLSPEVWAGANYPIERGADMLQERLGGMGMSGGSGGSAMAQYYADAQPQVYGQLANMISGAAQFPYSLGGSLWGGTQQNTAQPIVSQGSPGLLSQGLQMAAPFAMSHLPWGNFGGLLGGSGGPSTIGGQYANF